MQASERIEETLERAISLAQGAGAPPLLASALHYAVFPGGHRIRPQLCLAVAAACGDAHPAAASAAAAAIELLHCASLVHDDLPCFDDADTRRGKPSVHAQFGAPIAVLTGDALIVMAFDMLAREVAARPGRLGRGSFRSSRRRSGRPAASSQGRRGNAKPPSRSPTINAPRPAPSSSDRRSRARQRQRPIPNHGGGSATRWAKPIRWPTISAMCSATRANSESRSARTPGATARTPLRSLGSAGAKARLEGLVKAAVDSIPPCPGRSELRALIKAQTTAFFPKELALVAA